MQQEIKFYKNYTDAQLTRFKNHSASVRVDEQGQLEVLEQDIINPNGVAKTNKLISVIPEAAERIETFQEASSNATRN